MTELEDAVLLDDADALSATDVTSLPAPDRADAPVSEVTERFLRAVIAKVPLDRIEELHLFAPLRQGGTETGIAVVAARVPLSTPSLTCAADQLADDQLNLDVEDVSIAAGESDDSPYRSQDAVSGDVLEILPVEGCDDETVNDETVDDETVDVETDDVVDAPIVRHTVYTARYRLVLKGPERGTWEADVVDEADAPLITVEMVVRGVQRRAGEATAILRYTDRQIARALRMEWPLTAG